MALSGKIAIWSIAGNNYFYIRIIDLDVSLPRDAIPLSLMLQGKYQTSELFFNVIITENLC